MAAAEEVRFSLKVTMIKERCKVLYAEVDSDFADVLLSFLTLPLGTIARLLIEHYGNDAPVLGSLNSLYAGLQNMDGSHFWTEEGKLMLLNPRNSSGSQTRGLKVQIDDTPPIQYFACGTCSSACVYYKMKCRCTPSMQEITREGFEIQSPSVGQSVFTVQTASFLLTDNLQILSNSSASFFQILKENGVEDAEVLEERTLIVGLKEIMELLKGSFVSNTPITDIITDTATIGKRKKFPVLDKSEPEALAQSQTSTNIDSNPKKITVKVLTQKSTNRVLSAQTKQDFIELLFSSLTIPLGRVQFLLCNNAFRLGSIGNLYRSTSNLEVGDYMKSRETKTKLLEPQIPPHYLSFDQIFTLNQQNVNKVYKGLVHYQYKLFFLNPTYATHVSTLAMIDPKGHQDSFLKGPKMFMVTDDLKVSTPPSTSILSTLKKMGIPPSDVVEQELDIGMKEALSILKASLTSSCVLSEGLKPFLKRQLKQEQ